MNNTISRAALAAALALGAASAAAAQSSPVPGVPPPPPPAAGMPAPPAPAQPAMPDPRRIQQDVWLRFGPPANAAGALERAYDAIGEAEALNGRSGFLGQARTHYTGAYARYRRDDMPGTVAEAMAASALARAAIDDRAPVRPRGLEAPPIPPTAPPGMPDAAEGRELPGGGHLVRIMSEGIGGFGMGGFEGVDSESLDQLAAQGNTPEVRTLAERAKAAQAAARRARAAGDRPEARRQARLARDLSRAVAGLVNADHPAAKRFPGRLPRRPLGTRAAPGVLDAPPSPAASLQPRP